MWMKLAPWAVCVILFGLLLKTNQQLGEEREACNTERVSAALAASESARNAQRDAFIQRTEQLEAARRREADAREIAEVAHLNAQQEAGETQETIRRLMADAAQPEREIEPTQCLSVLLPADAVSGLR